MYKTHKMRRIKNNNNEKNTKVQNITCHKITMSVADITNWAVCSYNKFLFVF